MTFNADELYNEIKSRNGRSIYDEGKHCIMILNVMNNPNKGTVSAFCIEAKIGDGTFWHWLDTHEIFLQCYALAKMFARERWEEEGRALRFLDNENIGCQFEYWRMIGWSRYGVGKNSRIRLNLKGNNPSEHYNQLIQQASQGDFTAGEIKQLMEAINVGLNAHQVFELQKEIDSLKADLAKMQELKHGENTYTNKTFT